MNMDPGRCEFRGMVASSGLAGLKVLCGACPRTCEVYRLPVGAWSAETLSSAEALSEALSEALRPTSQAGMCDHSLCDRSHSGLRR